MKLLDPAIEILKKYELIRDDSEYVFPIYSNFHDSEERRHNRRKKVRKEINKNLKKIGEKLDLQLDLTTYVARHTYASVRKKKWCIHTYH